MSEIPAAWLRVIGLLVIIIGSYDIISGRNNLKPLIKCTIYIRLFFFAGIMGLVVSGQMPKEVIPLGVVDLLAAVWTIFALKAESTTSLLRDTSATKIYTIAGGRSSARL